MEKNNILKNIDSHEPKIKTVGDFFTFFSGNLRLPIYQRPYKWSEKHVNQLLNDIKDQSSLSLNYRLGSIVLHYAEEKKDNVTKGIYNIVDGQQRIVTLMLILRAMIKHDSITNKTSWAIWKGVDEKINSLINTFTFQSEISEQNIARNYRLIKQKIAQEQFNLKHVQYLLDNCEIVIFILDNIAEAFQFFDSQNARGKALAPHDLLKAYHLREFEDNLPGLSNQLIDKLLNQTVSKWERIISEESGSKYMHLLFEKYLYRIRRWNMRKKALTYSTKDIDIFKGVNFQRNNNLPYIKGLYTLYANEINSGMKFNYQLDQPIINGYHFFEMIFNYYEKTKNVAKLKIKHCLKIEDCLNSLDYRNTYGRKGDKYTLDMFDTVFFYYFDKFIDASSNSEQLKNAFDYFFIWAFRVRLENLRVDKKVIERYIADTRIIEKINFSLDGSDIINRVHKMLKTNNSNEKYFNHESLIDEFLEKNLLYEKYIPTNNKNKIEKT